MTQGRPEDPAETARWEAALQRTDRNRRPAPLFDPDRQPDDAEQPAEPVYDPDTPVTAAEVAGGYIALLAAALVGGAVGLFCALVLPQPLGAGIFALVVAACLAAIIILLRPRKDDHT